jgi:hypothetical protein
MHEPLACALRASFVRCSGAAPEADALQIGINHSGTQNALEGCVHHVRKMHHYFIGASRVVRSP